MSIIFLNEVVSDGALGVKQNDSIFLVPGDPIVHNLKLFLVTAAPLNHKYPLLLGLLNMVILDPCVLAFGTSQRDVSPQIFDQMVGYDFCTAPLFDQDPLIVVLLNQIARLQILSLALREHFLFENGASFNHLVESEHAIGVLIIQHLVFEQPRVLLRYF